EVAPTLDPAVVDRQPAGLPTTRTHAPPAPQPHAHHHSLGAEADVDDRCAGQTHKPVECRRDTHVALLQRPAELEPPAAFCDGGVARSRYERPATSPSP